MEFRVLTVSREFGSGGGRIAKIIADQLGWKLLDRDLIEVIANAAHLDSHEVSHYDERADPWLRKINRDAIRGLALAAGWTSGEAKASTGKRWRNLPEGSSKMLIPAGTA